jgi:D-alanyl-lipoteichoic acid acyltransferase DltB (MBOAT superfamily)
VTQSRSSIAVLFDSPIYFVFLSVVTLLYWRLSRTSQNAFLLGASYFFYGWWDWRFLLLMAGSTVIDFVIAQRISLSRGARGRRALLIASLIVNFTILGFFKYFDFFVDSFASTLSVLGVKHVPLSLLHIILPPGISFYTFQEVAYIVDVYEGRLEATNSLLDYALFISLFPHLIAGPIQRPSHLLPQVQTVRTFDESKVYDGLLLILSGLFRKCVIADNCALLANAAFGETFGSPNLFVLLLGLYAFAWQIYGDFSGYSDIARGSAQLLGFHFMVNFRQPYLARSLQEFWRRWHISLSTWLRDYLYIPLGGNAKGQRRTYLNLLITMLLGGLWHGANWTFVIWGAIHGLGLALERLLGLASIGAGVTSSKSAMLRTWIRRVLIFHLVCAAWIFFRATSVGGAFAFLHGAQTVVWRAEYLIAFGFLALFSFPLFMLDVLLERSAEEYLWQRRPFAIRTAFAIVLLLMITFFSGNDINAFIYFRF